ncbi:hypothetical protein JYT96_00535 [Gammaproteobacteria bacterium AH-315-C21]|nr:hypothetical protein [Gammaproteobacteria bacterium AH-315-C21]
MSLYSVDKLISEARKLAAEYRRTTGGPLPGISGEIARHDAMRLLDLTPAENGLSYDAIGNGSRKGKRVQIKARVIQDDNQRGLRLGQIKIEQEWDTVVLVLLNSDYQPFEVYEVEREEVIEASAEASQNRSKRGAITLARFKAISTLVWTLDHGSIDEGIWVNDDSH